jgi:hypothetical protein
MPYSHISLAVDTAGRFARRLACAAMLVAATIAGAGHAFAAPVVLTDAENQAYFNINGDVGNPAGLYTLTRPQFIAGDPNPPLLNDVVQQWYWFRVGNTAEQQLNPGMLQSSATYDTDLDGDRDRLELQYAGPGFTAFVNYSLKGSNVAEHKTELSRSVLIINTTAAPLQMSWIDYSDFSVTAAGRPEEVTHFPDWAQFLNASGNTIRQYDYDGPFDVGGPLNSEMQVVVTPAPTSFELGLTTDPNSILSRLNDGLPTLFNPAGATTLTGPGDLAFALQWNFTLPAFGSYIIGEDLTIVPEPASVAMIALGTLLLLPRRSNRRRT